ncbi:hypothetical protein GCM10011348_45820 [Marinobacterium nitratireducens]|uniref:Phage head morphogenesis domain-containing protein n=1 Tax=Marinobacterium nitratireducens TaxID=518897 RepID=A0A918DYZ8_9GAMM|nr:phage minor head protein [Marinobacterium nitratireducens]GGO89028.1 hypothetical protein GCM10011348_45820 [Marinobacterium nitratireducens]
MARLTRREAEEIRKLHSSAMRRAVLSAFTDIKNDVVLADLVARIEAGDIDGALAAINLVAAKFAAMDAALIAAYTAGGTRTANVIGTLNNGQSRVVFGFDVRAPRAERWLQDRSSELIVEIIQDQRDMIRDALERRMVTGHNPRTTALDIVGRIDRTTKRRTGGLIGLTRNQSQYVSNMIDDLTDIQNPISAGRYFSRDRRDRRFDSVIRRAIDEGKDLTAQQVRAISARYEDSLLQLRGETIGRTESINALRAGQQESVLQAMDVEGIRHSEAQKEWDASGDSRTRSDHRRMEGQAVPIDQPFIAPDGSRLMYPGDSSLGASAEQTIQCRCRQRTKVDFLGSALRLEGF